MYEHIVFYNTDTQGVLRIQGLAHRSVVLSSFVKTYNASGWKIGYALAPREISAEVQKIHQFNAFTINTPIQHALAEYLQKEEKYLGLGAFYQQKRDKFLQVMAGSRFKPIACCGTYFQMMDYSAISDLPDTEFAIELTKKHKVATIPISVFYHDREDNRVVRFCFAKENETLEQAGKILAKI